MTREIYAYACRRCGTLHYPFRMRCRQCGENDVFEFDPVPLPRHGQLVTFTHVHNLPAEYEVERLGIGIVELDNGMRVTGQLAVENPTMGMEVVGDVRVVRHETYQDYFGLIFRAA
jgi:uncharacterized OB-fold protein